MSDKRYWVWLQLCLGAEKDFLSIIDYFGSIEELYESNFLQRQMCEKLTPKMLERMDNITLDNAYSVIEHCDMNDWRVVTFEDEMYPKKLKDIKNPPAVLYVSGKMPDLNSRLSIGVVGTRNASPYAIECARVLSKGMARCGTVIVSGGARGIDSASHLGTLQADGDTIVVLGCGLASSYLRHDIDLKNQLQKNATILTEYPPKTVATRYTFPQRNRIISGLSDGVLVVEAAKKSGTLITAKCAKEQGRQLFAIPASILDYKFEGTNKLIFEGAKVVVNTESIVSEFENEYSTLDLSMLASNFELIEDKYEKRTLKAENDENLTFENVTEHRQNKIQIDQKSQELSGTQKAIFDSLTDEFEEIAVIAKRASVEIKDALVAFTMLEINGLVEAGMGKRYKRKQS